MKYVIHKAIWNYEKEEQWLNEMSAKGLAFTDYSWCRYVFTDAPAGQYIYRIELLENMPTHPESQSYLRFLEESGVEFVSSYMRWVYLRKPASDGAFDYSKNSVKDELSKIKDENSQTITKRIASRAKAAKGTKRCDDITVIALKIKKRA